MAPAFAMPRMLDRAGIGLEDFDLYEIHEAFAAQVLCTLKAWADPVFCRERLGRDAPLGAIDPDKLNVNGGSLAAGHPFAATGGRIVGGLAKALHERGVGPRRHQHLRGRRPGRRRRAREARGLRGSTDADRHLRPDRQHARSGASSPAAPGCRGRSSSSATRRATR